MFPELVAVDPGVVVIGQKATVLFGLEAADPIEVVEVGADTKLKY
ncbi:hypothetical protein GCM10028808_75310 [Spirosoma migulaei]